MTRFAICGLLVASAGALLAGCGNSSSGAQHLSTASILGEAPAAASGERPGITKDDPMARPVQVAWTSARAQKCGFNFDPSRLKTSYLSYEQAQGADAARLANVTKSYDMTIDKVRGNIGNAESYCTDKQSNIIKADLQRHLAGNYEPNFPEEKKAGGGFFDGVNDRTKLDRFDPKSIWRDLEDRKNGGKQGASSE